MSDKRISELTGAAALTGAEQLPIVQSGSTVRTTTQDIADLVPNLSSQDIDIQDDERIVKLLGDTDSHFLEFKNNSEESVVQFRGDKTIKFGSGSIGHGATPNSSIGHWNAVGSSYGFYASGNRSQSDFASFGTSTPNKFGAYRVNSGENGFFAEGNQAATSNRNGAFLDMIGTNTAENVGLKVRCDNGSKNVAVDITGGDIRTVGNFEFTTGSHDFKLGGGLATDMATIKNSSNIELVRFRGDGRTIYKKPVIVAPTYETSTADLTLRPQNGTSIDNRGIDILTASSTEGLRVFSNAVSGHKPAIFFDRVLNTATGSHSTIDIDADSGTGLSVHKIIDITHSGGGAKNVGAYFNVRNATDVNYAIEIDAGDIKFNDENEGVILRDRTGDNDPYRLYVEGGVLKVEAI